MSIMLRKIRTFLLDGLFPPRCGKCGAFAESSGQLCAECWKALTFLAAPCCACCGYPFAYRYADADALCAACMEEKPFYDGHRAMLQFDEHSKKLIHDLKYHDRLWLLPLFGRWLATAAKAWHCEGEWLIIPVPIHYFRLLKRKYNQAALLATALSPHLGQPVLLQGLKRIRHQPPQTGLSRRQRKKNLRRAFQVSPRYQARIKGATILLVDDVMTTGATLNACARVLKQAGAAQVYAVTLARTVLNAS
jgi:ComF family protein